jgi:hypothetical protein
MDKEVAPGSPRTQALRDSPQAELLDDLTDFAYTEDPLG